MWILIAKIVCLTVIAIFIIGFVYLWRTTPPVDFKKLYKKRYGKEWEPQVPHYTVWPLSMWNSTYEEHARRYREEQAELKRKKKFILKYKEFVDKHPELFEDVE